MDAGPRTLVRATGHLVLAYLRDTMKVGLGVKLQPTAALGSAVSAEGKVSLLGEADRNTKHTGRGQFFSPLPFL